MVRICFLLASAASAALALSGCQRDAAPPAAEVRSAAPRAVAQSAFDPAIRAADFAAHVKTLASDEFEGRAPGSAGEEKTVEYLRAQFQRMGLQPGNGDSYF